MLDFIPLEQKFFSWWLSWIIFMIPAKSFCGTGPDAVYLTWVEDPTTTMVVQWVEPKKNENCLLYLKQKEGQWQSHLAQVEMIEGTETVVKRVFLRNLKPDTDYAFCLDLNTETAKKYQFKTMPIQLFKPIRFVVGGDVYYHYELFSKMNATVAHLSPDFVILGGDIAYAVGYGNLFKRKDWEWRRWRTFLKKWSEQMIDENGRLIPLIVAIGNHDAIGSYQALINGEAKPSLFYTLFAFKERFGSYRDLLFGDYLGLFLLDTGHTHAVEFEQTLWLEEALKESVRFPYKMAVYHRPAYGSYGKYDNRKAELIRKAWVPLFERYGVQVAFEHHNHTYMRSKPIKEGKIDPKGVLYLGDGTWGVSPRKPLTPNEVFYIEKSAQINAVYLITMGQKDCHILAIDHQGNIFDKVPPLHPVIQQRVSQRPTVPEHEHCAR